MENFDFSSFHVQQKVYLGMCIGHEYCHIWEMGLYHGKQLQTGLNGMKGITFIYFLGQMNDPSEIVLRAYFARLIHGFILEQLACPQAG